MPLGMVLLMIVGVLTYFGVVQRLLDNMRMTDRQALIFIAAMIGGSFVDIPLLRGDVSLTVNVGGALLPMGLCLYLLAGAGTNAERLRAVFSTAVVAAIVFAGSRVLPNEPETMLLDPKLIYGAAAGITAYLSGRSRRSAFIGGVMGIILSDVIHLMLLLERGVIGVASIGGAGAFDVIVITGLLAVLTAEFVGEGCERISRRPAIRPQNVSMYEFSREIAPCGSEHTKHPAADGEGEKHAH